MWARMPVSGSGNVRAGVGVVVVGDAGEVVAGGVAAGEVAGLVDGLGEGEVAADAFGVAFAEVESDHVVDRHG